MTDYARALAGDKELSKAELFGMNLSRVELQGVNFKNANLNKASLRRANLQGADFQFANLSCADLREADLRDVNFNRANLCYADLSGARLRRADFEDAILVGARLSDADLRHATFYYADMRYADLEGADIDLADETIFSRFAFANLRGAKVPQLHRLNSLSEAVEWYDFIEYCMKIWGGKRTAEWVKGQCVDVNKIEYCRKIWKPRERNWGIKKEGEYVRSLVQWPVDCYCIFIWHVDGNGGFAFIPSRNCIAYWAGSDPRNFITHRMPILWTKS